MAAAAMADATASFMAFSPGRMILTGSAVRASAAVTGPTHGLACDHDPARAHDAVGDGAGGPGDVDVARAHDVGLDARDRAGNVDVARTHDIGLNRTVHAHDVNVPRSHHIGFLTSGRARRDAARA